MTHIGLGVIGLGVFGQQHARTARAMPDVDLVGVFDLDRELTAKTAHALGTRGCDSLAGLFALDQLDAVCVCTSDDQHVDAALGALEARKHILIEKPLATTVPDAERLVAAAEQTTGVVAAVGHILRHEPRYRGAQQVVSSGRIGDVVHTYTRRYNTVATANRVRGRTSVTMFLGVHDLDALTWITGNRIRSVAAMGSKTGPTRWGEPDAVVAALEYENGSVGLMEASWALPESSPSEIDAQLQIIGTRGRVEINIHDQGLRVLTEALTFPEPPGAAPADPVNGPLAAEIRAFIGSIRDKTAPTTSFADGLAAVAAAAAIDSSRQEAGRPTAVEYRTT